MKKTYRKWSAQQKEKMLLDIQRIGVVEGCRKHNISTRMYYEWLEKYESGGVYALENQHGKNQQAVVKRLQKENRILKEMLAEKELEARLKDELLKKKDGNLEQRKQAVSSVVAQGLSVSKAIAIAGISRSSYYYKSVGKRKGKAPSTHTAHASGEVVSNIQLITTIKKLLSQEFIDYGYKRTAHELRRKGWIINIKKVYRLMKEHRLLYAAKKSRRDDKVYVEHTKPMSLYPFHIMEVDIKYIWLHQQRRHAYLVTFLCVKTRFAIGWQLDMSMKSYQVANLLEQVLRDPLVVALAGSRGHTIRIRTDNGPQFIAKKLAEACRKLELDHEFIQPGTPQQNGHIEGFHSTVERLICQSYELRLLTDAKQVFTRFYKTYNYQRIMASIGYKTPYESLCEWTNTQGITLPKQNKYTCNSARENSTLHVTNHHSDLSSF